MPYVSTTEDEYHDSRTCRRLHATGGRIRRVETPITLTPCEHCVDDPHHFEDSDDDPEPDICQVELSSGGTCGRERPCPYHD